MEAKEAKTILDTPLAAEHARAGAKMGAWFGCALPDDFGDWQREYRSARESVALIDKNYRAYLSFGGPDGVRYLNAILTNNIRDLKTGEGAVSLLLNPQGHILAEIETYALPDRLLCASHAMIRERLIETLDKYIIMDDVTLTDETERLGALALEGPKAAAIVQELTGVDVTALPELGYVEVLRPPLRTQDDTSVAATAPADTSLPLPCRVVRRSPGGVAGAEFIVERPQLAALWNALLAKVSNHGGGPRAARGGPMGYAALSALRLEQGVPWFGYDFGEQQIPHEAGLENSHINYTKGCYTGQEIVERVRSRGHVNRVRVGLKFSGSEPPTSGTPLLADGKEAGYVTRTAFSPALDCAIGMGYLRREFSSPGSILHTTASAAEVVRLPISEKFPQPG